MTEPAAWPAPETSPARPPAARARAHYESTVREEDRLLLQILQTSISMIGFGFTINAFFQEVAVKGVGLDADQTARRLGLALLSVGLLLLASGLASQVRRRRELARRRGELIRAGVPAHLLDGALTPAFIAAVLLLIVSLAAIAAVFIRMFF